MKEQLISLDTAKKAKEKGFDEKTWDYYWKWQLCSGITSNGEIAYNSDPDYKHEFCCAAPTQSLLQKWLRDEHNIHIEIHYERGFWAYLQHHLPSEEDVKFANSGECQDGDLWLDSDLMNDDWYQQEYKSYEQALEEGLKKSLELL